MAIMPFVLPFFFHRNAVPMAQNVPQNGPLRRSQERFVASFYCCYHAYVYCQHSGNTKAKLPALAKRWISPVCIMMVRVFSNTGNLLQYCKVAASPPGTRILPDHQSHTEWFDRPLILRVLPDACSRPRAVEQTQACVAHPT